jgi:Uma2 family endonuclease
MSPKPGSLHQGVSFRISGELYRLLRNGRCEVFTAPFDVRFPASLKNKNDAPTVLQPDICVVCDRKKIDDRGCVGAPDLVIEILSPTNHKKELRFKYEVCEEAGVKEYLVGEPCRQICGRLSFEKPDVPSSAT